MKPLKDMSIYNDMEKMKINKNMKNMKTISDMSMYYNMEKKKKINKNIKHLKTRVIWKRNFFDNL